MKTRAPISKEEARTYYYEWKRAFDAALHEHIKASVAPGADRTTFETACTIVDNATWIADQVLARIVEKNDEIGRALVEQEKWSAEQKATT